MQSVKRKGAKVSRLILSWIMCLLMAGLIAGCPDPTELQKIIDNRIDARVTNERIDNRIDARVTNERIDNRIDARVTNERIDNRIDARVTEINTRIAEAGSPLDYVIDYSFANFDPVKVEANVDPIVIESAAKERRRREAFFEDLLAWLIYARDSKGFQLAWTKPVQISDPVEGYIEKVTLTNAQAVSDKRTHQDHIEAVIKKLAERAGDPNLAVPVRKDPSDTPLPVRRLTVVHNATSGVGGTKCDQKATYEVLGIPKEHALAYVSMPTRDIKQPLERDEEGRYKFDVPLECGEVITRDFAYILVKLLEPVVAQYRELEIVGTGVKKDIQIPVPLIEGAPACPPHHVPVTPPRPFPRESADYFMRELVEKCETESGWDQYS